MQKELLLQDRALSLVEQLRQRIHEPGLCVRHRRRLVDFTRQCRLTFPIMLVLLLQKSLKSLQARMHELCRQLAGGDGLSPLSGGAVTHARAKLDARVFVELNQQGVLPLVYGAAYAALVQRWRGHRLLAVDSSVVCLPHSPAVVKEFGCVPHVNGHGPQECGPQGRVSALYDVLNEVALDTQLVASTVAEGALALGHLAWVVPGDVVLNDRGYTGYQWLWEVAVGRGAHLVGRCSRSSFFAARNLFQRDRAGVSVQVTLRASKEHKAECRRRGWPLELTVRFVTVRLSTGELEVLVTSLLEEAAYPTAEFADLYWRRWGQETYYGRLKGRLDLENCSGRTVAAVQQDLAATVLLSNVESVIIGPAAAQLAERTARREQPAKINRAVSLHALKTRLIDLLASPLPPEQVLGELTQWFQANPVSVRAGRKVRRRPFSASLSYNFQRYVRKIVF